MPVQIVVEHGPWRGVARGEIDRRMKSMLKALHLEQSELSILLTNDERIHELNKDYRGKDRPTDVLAFAMREGEFGTLAGGLLGDVIVSIDTARRQAEERKVSALDEVTMLLAHGLLHLLGWDHETAAKDRAMRRETDKLVAAATLPVQRAKKPAAPKKAASRRRAS